MLWFRLIKLIKSNIKCFSSQKWLFFVKSGCLKVKIWYYFWPSELIKSKFCKIVVFSSILVVQKSKFVEIWYFFGHSNLITSKFVKIVVFTYFKSQKLSKPLFFVEICQIVLLFGLIKLMKSNFLLLSVFKVKNCCLFVHFGCLKVKSWYYFWPSKLIKSKMVKTVVSLSKYCIF